MDEKDVKELLRICKEMNKLLMMAATITFHEEIVRLLPYGLADKLKGVLYSTEYDEIIRKVEGG
jgi:hypothetical protein